MGIDLYANKRKGEGDKYCMPAPSEDFAHIAGVEEGDCAIRLTTHYHRPLFVPAINFNDGWFADTKEEIERVLKCIKSKKPDTDYGLTAQKDIIDFFNVCLEKDYIISIG